jgi:4-diphosphocytidyl-2C-methyl-D-erythritol kinase
MTKYPVLGLSLVTLQELFFPRHELTSYKITNMASTLAPFFVKGKTAIVTGAGSGMQSEHPSKYQIVLQSSRHQSLLCFSIAVSRLQRRLR